MLIYLTRAQWGARTDIPRQGYHVERSARTHVIFHHTVMVDTDVTKNVWETLDEVKAKMQQLQTIRPDLGLDVPYNFVFFLMANGNVFVCEGRGYDRTGAHTHSHNTDGIGIAGMGNFELATVFAPSHISAINQFLGGLASAMPNLGSGHGGPPSGREVNEHQDYSQTACCGARLRAVLSQFTLKEVSMAEEVWIVAKGHGEIYAVCGGTLVHIHGGEFARAQRGNNWRSTVVEVASNDARLRMPTTYPAGVPPSLR